MNPNLANSKRVEETATFIAGELRVLLDRTNFKGHLIVHLRESCPAYKNVTNVECCLATLRALALAQADVIADIESLTWPHEEDRIDWIEEDDAAAAKCRRRHEAQSPPSAPSPPEV